MFTFQDGTKLVLKNVTPGNSVFSMLGILDVLTVCRGVNGNMLCALCVNMVIIDLDLSFPGHLTNVRTQSQGGRVGGLVCFEVSMGRVNMTECFFCTSKC